MNKNGDKNRDRDKDGDRPYFPDYIGPGRIITLLPPPGQPTASGSSTILRYRYYYTVTYSMSRK